MWVQVSVTDTVYLVLMWYLCSDRFEDTTSLSQDTAWNDSSNMMDLTLQFLYNTNRDHLDSSVGL